MFKAISTFVHLSNFMILPKMFVKKFKNIFLVDVDGRLATGYWLVDKKIESLLFLLFRWFDSVPWEAHCSALSALDFQKSADRISFWIKFCLDKTYFDEFLRWSSIIKSWNSYFEPRSTLLWTESYDMTQVVAVLQVFWDPQFTK